MADKEKLVELIENAPVWKNGSFNEACTQVADHLIANNVVIQKQSEWVEFVDDDPYIGELRYPMCKRCNHIALVASRYCPDCGAKMDGAE